MNKQRYQRAVVLYNSLNTCRMRESAEMLSNMAVQAYEEHVRTGELNSISLAVGVAALSVQITSEESKLLPGFLDTYGVILETRYKRIGETCDLESTIQTA